MCGHLISPWADWAGCCAIGPPRGDHQRNGSRKPQAGPQGPAAQRPLQERQRHERPGRRRRRLLLGGSLLVIVLGAVRPSLAAAAAAIPAAATAATAAIVRRRQERSFEVPQGAIDLRRLHDIRKGPSVRRVLHDGAAAGIARTRGRHALRHPGQGKAVGTLAMPARSLALQAGSLSFELAGRAGRFVESCLLSRREVYDFDRALRVVASASTVRPIVRKSLSGRVPPSATSRNWAAISCGGRSSGCDR